MPRRLGFLVAVAAIFLAVGLTAWQRQEGGRASVPAHPEIPWDIDESIAATDPELAVETILGLRAQFGSVLANSELEVVEPAVGQFDVANDPVSFDGILRAAAGVETQEEPANVPELTRIAAENPDRQGRLGESLRSMADMLNQSAQEAKEKGDVTLHQRFMGLAMLLQAEADALSLEAK